MIRPSAAVVIAEARWGRSSAGRATRSQCVGREFDPLRLHQLFQGLGWRRLGPFVCRRIARGMIGHLGVLRGFLGCWALFAALRIVRQGDTPGR